MYKLGTIILTPFPFTDLSGSKVRPALIVSKMNPREQDVIVCFITSKSERNQYAVKIDNTPETGLKVPSTIIATQNTDKKTSKMGILFLVTSLSLPYVFHRVEAFRLLFLLLLLHKSDIF